MLLFTLLRVLFELGEDPFINSPIYVALGTTWRLENHRRLREKGVFFVTLLSLIILMDLSYFIVDCSIMCN